MILPAFSLMQPGETRYGAGRFAELASLLPRFGRRIALARGGESFTRSGLRDRLHTLGIEAGVTLVELPPQTREPEPEDVDAAAAMARAAGVEALLAIGGGSVLDLGKAVAAMAPQDPAYGVRDYLEGVGTGRTLAADPLPLVAVPTTAGTGTEATKNAVLSSQRDGFKKSLRDPRMLPRVAVIDPALTVGLPPAMTAWSGMDAITQLIEAYTSRRAQPVTDMLALGGLEHARALPEAYRAGEHLAARAHLSLAAYLSGVCLANAGLGAAHGIAAALGSVAPIGHGLACAVALPWVMAINLSVVAERYARVGEVLTGIPCSSVDQGARAAIDAVWQLLQALHIPRAVEIPGVAEALAEPHLPALAARCHGNSLQGNPRSLANAELVALLRAMRDAPDPRTWAREHL